MYTTWTIDWLAFNAIGTYDLKPQAMAYQYDTWQWSEVKGVYGYDRAVTTADGCKIMWSTTRQDMGTFISYPGKAINAYLQRGIHPQDIMLSHGANGDVCRRIDLAIDTYNSGLSISGLYGLFRSGGAQTSIKKYSLITSNSGQTLYIGSRESEQFIRVYDKAKEQGDFTSDRIRIEVELKGQRAKIMCNLIAHNDPAISDARTRALINSIVTFDDPTWIEVMGTASIGVAKAKDNESDTEKWLLEQVAPAMARYILKTDNHDLLIRFNNIVNALAPKLDM